MANNGVVQSLHYIRHHNGFNRADVRIRIFHFLKLDIEEICKTLKFPPFSLNLFCLRTIVIFYLKFMIEVKNEV